MANLKDISKYANVSVSTVSQVLNGKAEEMRISKETTNRVFDAATKLNYHPNMNARRLKSSSVSIPSIAFFWAVDISPYFLTRCLEGIQKMVIEDKKNFDLVIQPYRLSELHLSRAFSGPCEYSGIVIANASDKDMEFLHNTNILTPIVLLNRHSEKLCCVSVNSDDVVGRLFEMLINKNCKALGLVLQIDQKFNTSNLGKKIIDKCRREGIEIRDEWVSYGESSTEGGRNATLKILNAQVRPQNIFYASAVMAGCVPRLFSEEKILIPDEIGIISYGGHEYVKDMVPSITTIEIPLEAMAEKCCEMLLDTIEDKPFMKKAEFYARANYMESFTKFK